ncbi:MAG TPA: hypothetical protein VNM67_03050 [Thermoanaerobaculia bacterium]|jgi:hypothetical protein|nr:hypothetical protein [Thermoanaerobaculia bacterium]
MAAGTAETTDRILGVLEGAFRPLEAHTSVEENGNVQLRILDGSEAILIDERPLYGTHSERVAFDWIADTRKRLEELGRQLDPWEPPGK